jgi:hypothetical protein
MGAKTMAVVFRSSKKFTLEIESSVKDNNFSYIEAVIDFCEKNGVEPDAIGKLIDQQLKDKIESEAIDLHFLPQRGKLPI